MRILISFVAILLASAIQVSAGEKLSGPQIEAALNDRTAWYLPLQSDSARQYFHRNGETPYVDAKGGKTYGEWMVRGDQYCSIWPPSEHRACFDVKSGTLENGTPTITFISGGGGKRYEAVLKFGKHIDEPWIK